MKKISMCLFVMACAAMVMTTGCKKYPDGGSIAKAEKNLKKSWKLTNYLRNGNDETSQLLISSYSETYGENEAYSRTYIDADGDPVSEAGDWKFDSDKQQVNIFGIGSIELTAETSTVSSSDYDVLRLTKDEYRYYYKNGGDTHEFHFKPK